jgi:catechol 2,3-dioxygenase-like lactoylglutathione lyase family enzyme
MKFLSLSPFVPSGSEFEKSKQFFSELGFRLNWQSPGYAGFEGEGYQFILQHFDKRDFAENFMVSVGIENAEQFRNEVLEKQLPEKFGIRIGEVTQQPYGKEVNLIDLAGVCWHFVEE